METVLSIVGLALSVGSLVPAFTATNVRIKIILVSLCFATAGVFICQIVEGAHKARTINAAKVRLSGIMSANRPMTVEQIREALNSHDPSIVQRALDELQKEGAVHERTLEVQSARGTKYLARIYNSVNYPIE